MEQANKLFSSYMEDIQSRLQYFKNRKVSSLDTFVYKENLFAEERAAFFAQLPPSQPMPFTFASEPINLYGIPIYPLVSLEKVEEETVKQLVEPIQQILNTEDMDAVHILVQLAQKKKKKVKVIGMGARAKISIGKLKK